LKEHLKMMKFIAVACIAAVAFAEPEAEADAALLYGAYGYNSLPAYAGYGYSNLGYSNLGYSKLGYSAYGRYPYTGYGYSNLGYSAVTGYGKRSADAEPEAEADAALLYGAYGYNSLPAYAGYGYSNLGYSNLGYSTYNRYPYTGYGYSNLRYSGVTGYGKRSADAEPEAEANAALLYGAYGYNSYPAYTGYGYSNLGYSNLGYSAYGRYPYTGYSNLGYSHLGYSAYPYAG